MKQSSCLKSIHIKLFDALSIEELCTAKVQHLIQNNWVTAVFYPTSHPHLLKYSQLMVVHYALYAMHSCADVLNLHRNLIQKESCCWFRTAHLITRFKRFQLALFQKITPLCDVRKQQMVCCMATISGLPQSWLLVFACPICAVSLRIGLFLCSNPLR